MKFEDGVIPSIAITLSFLLGIALGSTIAHRSEKNDILIEKCEQTNGRYDFCEKKIDKKEYYVLKELGNGN